LRRHSERSEESFFGLFRATKSIHAKEFFPLLAKFIDETNRTAVRQLRGTYLPPTDFPLLLGLPALPTLCHVPKTKNHPKIAGSVAALRKELKEI